MGKLNPGDKIVVETESERFAGVVMPRPALSNEDYITIKIENGYNIGLKKDILKKITVIEKYTLPKEDREKDSLTLVEGKPSISFISTGGTIASRVDYKTGGVYASFNAKDILESFPELRNIANIKAVPLMNVMSEDMNPTFWKEMAISIASELNSGAEGVVLAHGTDTMHYSSAALSFLLPNLGKPVVLTGAQRSSDRGSSDTHLNLICSAIFTTKNYGGVYIIMHGSLNDDYCLAHNGTRVRKIHTTRRDAVQTINVKPVARVYLDGRIQEVGGPSHKRTNEKVAPDLKIEEKVALIRIYPGMDPEIIDFYLNKEYKGIVFEGTALGHVPTTIKETSLIPKIEKARDLGVAMAMTTQCLYGRVHPYVYSNLREVSSRGVIYCEDMLPETTYIKMMWVLGHTRKFEKVREMMLTNYAGELSKKTEIEDECLESKSYN